MQYTVATSVHRYDTRVGAHDQPLADRTGEHELVRRQLLERRTEHVSYTAHEQFHYLRDRSLTGSGRADDEQHLLQVLATRHEVAEPLLQDHVTLWVIEHVHHEVQPPSRLSPASPAVIGLGVVLAVHDRRREEVRCVRQHDPPGSTVTLPRVTDGLVPAPEDATACVDEDRPRLEVASRPHCLIEARADS